MGMGMFTAVGRGSDNPPRMIVLRSGGAGEKDARGRHLAIVGKGVCFDSGGISIKPAERMEDMKMDKTGACTVISAIATVAELAPGTPLLAIAPAVENMPGPHSTRPGDIVRALNGKMVDITNTDAEGRLILGDAMTYAEQLGATHLVDVATLTGAVGRALGNLVTGAFGDPQGWYDEVVAAGARAGERYWQLPLVDDYRPDMESWYGDISNSGTVEASLVKSGLFLREFVTRPWVHLDIASTAYFRKAMPWAPRGATGVAHATLVELALAGAAGPAGTPAESADAPTGPAGTPAGPAGTPAGSAGTPA
jgi:leucyl aminopeptidase